MRSQGTRHGLKIKKKAQVENDTLPPPSTGIEDDEGYSWPLLGTIP